MWAIIWHQDLTLVGLSRNNFASNWSAVSAAFGELGFNIRSIVALPQLELWNSAGASEGPAGLSDLQLCHHGIAELNAGSLLPSGDV